MSRSGFLAPPDSRSALGDHHESASGSLCELHYPDRLRRNDRNAAARPDGNRRRRRGGGDISGNAGRGAIAGAGLARGLIYDQVKKSEQSAYAQGYAAGQSRRRYQPPQ